jgi:hypothetical protein
MPGASRAMSRKLRSGLGRFSICSRETLVPISDVRDSVPAAPAARTSTAASCCVV